MSRKSGYRFFDKDMRKLKRRSRRPVLPAPHPGAIDCDVHIAVPQTRTLVPFLDEYWADHVRMRGVETQNYQMSSLPPRAPLSVRPDWQASGGALPGSDFGDLKSKVLDHFKLRFAVCNC